MAAIYTQVGSYCLQTQLTQPYGLQVLSLAQKVIFDPRLLSSVAHFFSICVSVCYVPDGQALTRCQQNRERSQCFKALDQTDKDFVQRGKTTHRQKAETAEVSAACGVQPCRQGTPRAIDIKRLKYDIRMPSRKHNDRV